MIRSAAEESHLRTDATDCRGVPRISLAARILSQRAGTWEATVPGGRDWRARQSAGTP